MITRVLVRRAFPVIDLTIQTFIERQFRTSRIRFHGSIEFEAKVFIQSEILAKMRTDARQCNHLALKRRGKRNAYKSISGETQCFLFESGGKELVSGLDEASKTYITDIASDNKTRNPSAKRNSNVQTDQERI